MKKAIHEFIQMRLGGEVVPPDLEILLTAFSERRDFAENKENPLACVGAELMWMAGTYPLLDHNYLSERDWADADIMANVRAMQDTDKKLKFVLQHEDTSLLGYWQPSPELPLNCCALFWLDTEGQYRIAEGNTLAETLAYRALAEGDEDACFAVTQVYEQLGISIPKIEDDILFDGMEAREAAVSETPQDYRSLRFERHQRVSDL